MPRADDSTGLVIFRQREFCGEQGALSDELFIDGLNVLTGVDVFIPAVSGGTGTVEVVLLTRGGSETFLNVPNWPSSSSRVSVLPRNSTLEPQDVLEKGNIL